MKKKKLNIPVVILAVIAVGCLVYIGIYFLQNKQFKDESDKFAQMVKNAEQSALAAVTGTSTPTPTPVPTSSPTPAPTAEPKEIVNSATPIPTATSTPTPTPSPSPTPIPEVLAKYKELYDLNNDLVGWMEIEGTLLNNLVVQASSDKDNEYYIKRTIEGSSERHGCLFVEQKCNVLENRSTNIMIHGHNMKSDGTMFNVIWKYKDKKFFDKHPIIKFDTIYEEAEYQVVAALYVKAQSEVYDDYWWFTFVDAPTETAFDKYAQKVMEGSLYETDQTLEYGDELITLITCTNPYWHDNYENRFIVIAKKIK